MSKSPLNLWLEKNSVSNEDAATASASIGVDKSHQEDPANAVPGEHSEKGQGQMDATKTKLNVTSPEKLDVTDVPHNDDGENQGNANADNGIKANPNKAAGSKSIGEVSLEDTHPNEPVIGGKLPGEGQMDENPRGTLHHEDGKQKVHVADGKDLDVPDEDPDGAMSEQAVMGKVGVKDHNPGTHEPSQTNAARKALEGELHHADGKTHKASLEDLEGSDGAPVAGGPADGAVEPGEGAADLTQPAAPVGTDGTDAGNAGDPPAAPEGTTDVPVAEGSVPATAEAAPATELGAEIAAITGHGDDPVQEAADHMGGVADDLENMEKMQSSLEQYLDILTEATAKGGLVDPLLARTIKVGLEAYGEPWLTAAIPSLEGFEDPTGRYTVSQEAVDNVKGKLASIGEGVVNAVNKLIEWIIDLWNRLTQDAGKLREQAKSVEALVKSIKDTNEKPMPVKGGERLYIGDVFAGDGVQPIVDLNKYGTAFLVQYPKMIQGMLKQFNSQIASQGNRLDANVAYTIALAVFQDNFKPQLLGMAAVSGNGKPGSMSKFDQVVQSKPLPGNMAFFAGLNQKTRNDDNTGGAETTMILIKDIFKMDFGRIPSTAPARHEDSVKAPNQGVLQSMLHGVDSLIELMEEMHNQSKVFTELKQSMNKNSRTAAATGARFDGVMFNGVMFNILAKASATPLGSFSGYLASIVKVYLAMISAFAKHHGAQAADTTPVAERAQPGSHRALPAA